jgi:ferredoxin-NADP reductase
MKARIRGRWRDLAGLPGLVLERRRRIRRASAAPVPADPLRALTESLHPERLDLEIRGVRRESEAVRTYTLVPAPGARCRQLPAFRAGQYLSVELAIRGHRVSRPYSIVTSPAEAQERNLLELTIQRRPQGFAAPYIWEHWRPGTRVTASGPLGQFYFEPLRDRRQLLFLAGGCGITPFRSLWRDLRDSHPDVTCTLLYGAERAEEFVFRAELEELAAELPGRFQVHFLPASPPPGWTGPSGLLSAGSIRRLVNDPGGRTCFICGPPGMYRFLKAELEVFDLPPGRIRSEACGPEDVSRRPDFPAVPPGRVFKVRVTRGRSSREIPARADETLLCALEKAGLAPPAQCRSGTCGCCRSRLSSGRVFVPPESDGRRLADRRFGYLHPCSAYPLTDLEVTVPENPPPPAAMNDTEP